MKGLTVFETEAVYELISEMRSMRLRIEEMYFELKEAKKPYLTAKDLQELTGFSKTWINDNKQHIGYSLVGGQLRFKRSDVDAFMETRYYKIKKSK